VVAAVPLAALQDGLGERLDGRREGDPVQSPARGPARWHPGPVCSGDPVPSFTRSSATLDDWRTFAGRYRKYATVGVTQAMTTSLAGDALTIPLLLALGCPPALATVIGVLPVAGTVAQLGVPWLLRRANGNLRRVTLAILAVGELRGFVLAAVTLLVAGGVIPDAAAIGAIAVVMGVAGAAGTIGGTNLQAWYGAVLAERDRRFVAPKVVAANLGLGAIILLPVALVVQTALPRIGIAVYAGVFVLSGIAGIAELLAVRRLRHPGRVRVHEERPAPTALPCAVAPPIADAWAETPPAAGGPPPAAGGPPTLAPATPLSSSSPAPPPWPVPPFSPALRRFLRIITVAAFGAGFGPYFSIYAISVLGLPASFAILLSAISSASALVASAVIGGWLHRGSASRLLRLSFLLRGGSLLFGLLAFPANPAAALILCGMAVLVNAGYAAGVLASNERLLRLGSGPQLIRAQGRFVAGTSVGVTTGQFLSAGVLAALPIGFPAFAILFLVSGAFRVGLIPFVEVSESWSTATSVWSVDELVEETRRDGPEGPAGA